MNADGAGTLIELDNSTFSGNHSTALGGGLAIRQGVMTLSSVTVADNFLDAPLAGSRPASPDGAPVGGGVYMSSGAVVTVRNSLIARNTDLSGAAPDCFGSYDSKDYNLVQNLTGCTLTDQTTHNVTGKDPRLLPLGNFGGSTDTQALLGDSPAVDAGNPGGCRDAHGTLFPYDQRFQSRSFDGDLDGTARCDIGAYELVWLARLLLPLVVR